MAAKPLLTPEQLAAAKAMYEMGDTPSVIAERFGVDIKVIDSNRRRKNWVKIDDASMAATKKARAIVDGIVDDDTIKRREQIEVAADNKAQVLQTHAKEWVAVRKNLYPVIKSFGAVPKDDFAKLRNLKLLTEVLKNTQEGERKALGISDEQTSEGIVIRLDSDDREL